MSKICMISFGDLANPKNGYAIRCMMLAKKLKDSGHSVKVFQFAPDSKIIEKDGITIQSIGVRHEQPSTSFLKKYLGFAPFKELYFPFDSYLKIRKLKKELKHFDEFYIELTMLVGPTIATKQFKKKVTIDTHCIHKDVALKLRKQNKFVGTIRTIIWHILEKSMFKRADHLIAISENDKKFITQHYNIKPEKISVVPHVVDPANHKKYKKLSTQLRTKLLKNYKLLALFLGDLKAIQNIESVKYINNTLAPATPDVHYVIVGNNPQKHKSNNNISYTGFVDYIDPYIMAADICIAPMTIGSGVKTKVLDYLKYNKKVLATPVALEGIDDDDNAQQCDINDFANEVKKITGDS